MNKLRFLFFCLVIFITLTITVIFTYFTLEPKTYDFLVKHVTTQKLPFDKSKNVYGHDDIVLVMVDDKSIEKHRWPWKRDLYNKVLNYFFEYSQPKVVVHDFIIRTTDQENPEADKRYFKTVENYSNLVEGFTLMPSMYPDQKLGDNYDNIFTDKFKIKNIELKTHIPELYNSMFMSPLPYLDYVQHMGAVTFVPGFFDGFISILLGDETFRTHEYLINYKGSILPTLAMSSFLIVNNNPKIIVDDKYISFPDLNYNIKYINNFARAFMPIKFYKQYESGYSYRSYSAIDIIDSYENLKSGKKPIIEPNEFKDKIVVFGANVTVGNGLNDKLKSPLRRDHSGTDMQAITIDNIFHNDFLQIMPNWLNILISILSIICVFCIIKYNSIVKSVIYSLVAILGILICAVICYYYEIIILVVTPIILSIYTMMVTYIHRYVVEERSKKKVTKALGKYMSEDVMKSVIQNIDNLGLGGKKAIVTVLFSDIRGFTSLSEKLTAQEVSQLLNEYFSEMEPIVSKYNGIINKFIGDAVMAVFGEPIQNENHSKNAVLCGYEMLRKVEELDEKWQKEGKNPIKIGIGINTGEVFVGNIGSEKRMEYTVIGDTVNLASRLESYNKTFGTNFLISASTYEASKDILEVNKIANVEIRGKANKIDIFEVKKAYDN